MGMATGGIARSAKISNRGLRTRAMGNYDAQIRLCRSVTAAHAGVQDSRNEGLQESGGPIAVEFATAWEPKETLTCPSLEKNTVEHTYRQSRLPVLGPNKP